MKTRMGALVLAALCVTAAWAQEDVYHMTGADFLRGGGGSSAPVIRSGGYGLPVAPGNYAPRRASTSSSASIVVANNAPGAVQFWTAFGGGSYVHRLLSPGQQITVTGRGTPHVRFPDSRGRLVTYDLRNRSYNTFQITRNRGLDLVYQPPM